MNKIKKTILYITPFYPPEYAGGARAAHSIAKSLTNEFNFLILTKQYQNSFNSPLFKNDNLDNINIIRCKNFGKSIISKIFSIIILIIAFIKNINKFDCIHFIGIPNEVFIFTVLGKLFNKPMISTIELMGDDDLLTIKNSFLGYFKIKILNLHYKIACLSKEILNTSSKIKSLKDKLIELPNCIELEKYYSLNEKDKIKLKNEILTEVSDLPKLLNHDNRKTSNKQIILFCGHLCYRKGLDLIIKLIKKNRNFINKHNLHFILIGPKGEENIYKELKNLKRLNILSLINTLPPEKIIKFYQISDFFIFPSRSEGLARVTLEAKACNLIFIGSNIESIKEVFKHNFDGVLFKSGSFKDLNIKFKNLIKNKILQESIKINCKNSFDPKYSLDNVVIQHKKWYNNLLCQIN